MAQNPENNPQIITENIGTKGQKPRQIRKVVLMIQEMLMIYSSPITIKDLRKNMELKGHTVGRKNLYRIITDIKAHPVPGYTLVQTFTKCGCNKATPAYQLKKISYVHIQQKKG